MNQAELIIFLVQCWAAVGALVALPFLTFGMDQIDEDARGAYVFRPLLVPGILLLWPLVLWRWYVLATDREVWARRYQPGRSSHKWCAVLMGVAIVFALVVGLSVRKPWPADIAPEQLAPAAEAKQ